MDENDALSENNKIPLGHNRINGAVYSKFTSKLRSALHSRYSKVIPCFISGGGMLCSPCAHAQTRWQIIANCKQS